MKCPGCKGLGWVETSDRFPHVCPVCNGTGTRPEGVPSEPLPAVPRIPWPYPAPTVVLYGCYPAPGTAWPDYDLGPWYTTTAATDSTLPVNESGKTDIKIGE